MFHLFCLRAWPDLRLVKQKWESIIEPLFEILSYKEIVFSEANWGKWVPVKDAIFNQLSESDLKELLQRVLLGANVSVVSLPSHVFEAISSFSSCTEIEPRFTRIVLKGAPACDRRLTRREKLRLLHFCLQDDQYKDLCGLELLPLSNGKLTAFSPSSLKIYISSPEHPQDLLPGLQNRFLDQTVDHGIIHRLKHAARLGN